MDQKHHANLPSGELLNTLAQNGTKHNIKPPMLISGKGSDLTNEKSIKGKAKRKTITQTMVLRLLDATNKNSNSEERRKGYWNTYHCQNKLYSFNGRIYGKYCKNRACTLCSSIRKAEIINKYLPVINTWSDPYFLTLTVKAVSKKLIYKRMRDIMRAFRIIKNKYRKQNLRGNSIKLRGIKSLECNFNASKRTYNPHLHLIVPNQEIADALINEWLKIWTTKFTSPKAQHKSPINDKEKALIEVIKYGSKIFTEPDVCNKSNSINNRVIYAAALDNILKAMKGLRIFERFGFDLPKRIIKNNSKTMILNEYDEWVYDSQSFDWINTINDENLSDYKPQSDLIDLLKNNVDVDLE